MSWWLIIAALMRNALPMCFVLLDFGVIIFPFSSLSFTSFFVWVHLQIKALVRYPENIILLCKKIIWFQKNFARKLCADELCFMFLLARCMPLCLMWWISNCTLSKVFSNSIDFARKSHETYYSITIYVITYTRRYYKFTYKHIDYS